MSGITTHVLDNLTGRPGAGMRIDFSKRDGDGWTLVKTIATNADGRTAEPLLVGDDYKPGRYEVLMNVGEYFARLGAPLPQPAFLSKVPLRIVIHDAAQRVHLPVLFSPWGYSFYRGS